MATPPRAIRLDSAKDVPGLVRLLIPWLRDVRNALTSSLSVSDNLAAQWIDLEWTGGTTDQVVATRFQRPIKAVALVYARRNDKAAMSTALYLDWENATSGTKAAFNVRSITGLTSGDKYTLRFLVVGA